MKHATFLIFFILNSLYLYAQEEKKPQDKASNFSMGIQMSSFGKDFGWGLHFTSPYFLKERLAVRLSAQYQYYDHLDTSVQESVWSPYWVFKLGFVSVSNTWKDVIRLYSHTGAVVALPNAKFSDQPVAFGAYTKLGLELMFNSSKQAWGSYFIEGGWIGIFSKATLLPGKPIYGNGFLASMGVRFYF